MWIRCENALSCCSGARSHAASSSGEHRLPACSSRPLVDCPSSTRSSFATSFFAASCRELQAGSLCSQQAESASLFGSPNISRDDGSESTISPGYVVSSHDTATTCGYIPERGDACQGRHKAGGSAYAEICIEICSH